MERSNVHISKAAQEGRAPRDVIELPARQYDPFHTMKLCCKGDQEYMKGIPATVDSGRMAMA